MISPTRILITGATGGLGSALALRFARSGRTLILHGRKERPLADLAAACTARGAEVVTLAFDLRETDEFMARLDAIAMAAPIDLAIVNAGVNHINLGDGEPWDEVERVLDVNLRAAMATVAVLVPPMRRRGQGQIALVSSLAAYYGLGLTPAYCASKAGLKAYGEALRGWLAPQGVAVNVVLPGFVKTPMSDGFAGPKPFMITAEDAARRIERGLARNRARISFPQPLAFGSWLLSALPAAWSQFIVRRLGY